MYQTIFGFINKIKILIIRYSVEQGAESYVKIMEKMYADLGKEGFIRFAECNGIKCVVRDDPCEQNNKPLSEKFECIVLIQRKRGESHR
jgi:hypothetical protein